MSFKDDLAVCEAAQPYQDDVYQHLFPVEKITRYQKGSDDERHILDRIHHIDVELEFRNGITITGQEKALRNKFAHFNTFTVEFYQVDSVKEEGEFFNLGAQFYLHSYLNAERTGLSKWYLVNVLRLFDWLMHKDKQTLEEHTKSTGSSRASFFNIDYQKLPQSVVYASHKQYPNVQWSIKDSDNTQSGLNQYAND